VTANSTPRRLGGEVPKGIYVPRQRLVGPVTGRVYPHARRVGLTHRDPNDNEKAWLAAVRRVQERYEDLLPLSLRAHAYRIVGLPDDPPDFINRFNKKLAVDYIEDFLGIARRAKWVEWDSVWDSRTETITVPSDLTPEALDWRLVQVAKGWERDRRLGQRFVPEVWVEAVGSMRSVEDPCRQYGAAIVSSGGTNSLSEIRKLAARVIVRWVDRQQRTVLLLIGDHDGKGMERLDRAVADTRALIRDLYIDRDAPQAERDQKAEWLLPHVWVAVTDDQITDWDLVASDEAGTKYEVEAADPIVLRDHLAAQLRAYTSTRLLGRVVTASRGEAAARVRWLDRLAPPAPPGWRWTDGEPS
jgi:hypothetical protein